jgi:DNA-binding transcriptional LysR family regulator
MKTGTGAETGAALSNIDATDFLILKEIYRSKSVSAVVDKISIGQSSISIRLGKLRKHFNDPLFVRTSAGMQPTPRMEALIAPIGDALSLFNGSAGAASGFDAINTHRTFRICMSDTCQGIILPKLLTRLGDIAPLVRIESTGLSPEMVHLLESGEADIAMGCPECVPTFLYQQKLFDEQFVCLVAADHPRITGELNAQQFSSERQIDVDLPRGNGQRILAQALEESGIARNVVLQLPSYLGIARIVANSDLIAVVPSQLGSLLKEEANIRSIALPVLIPSYPIKQYWHARFHGDPANRWLRHMIAEICAV